MNYRLNIIVLVTLVFLSQSIIASVHSCKLTDHEQQSISESVDDSDHMDHSEHDNQPLAVDCCNTAMHCSMAGCAVFIPTLESHIVAPPVNAISLELTIQALTNKHTTSLYRPPIVG